MKKRWYVCFKCHYSKIGILFHIVHLTLYFRRSSHSDGPFLQQLIALRTDYVYVHLCISLQINFYSRAFKKTDNYRKSLHGCKNLTAGVPELTDLGFGT